MIRTIKRTIAKAFTGGIRFFPQWMKEAWPVVAFRRLIEEGYRRNSAVYACTRLWANSFPEPELHVWDKVDGGMVKLPDHPARKLFGNPNPFMGERLFGQYLITYMLLGGAGYIWKERARDGSVIALWPLHAGQVRPVPDPTGWLSHYHYDDGTTAEPMIVPASDIICVMWAQDPLNPLVGLSPVIAAARAIDTDNEALRYEYSLLKNDATPQTLMVLKQPAIDLDEFKQRLKKQYGGENIGEPMVLEGTEATIQRTGLSLKEMAAETLHNIPESRIAAAFEVPAVMVGLNVGLQRAIQGAPRELQEYWTETVRVPRWQLVADQIRLGLKGDFDLSATEVLAYDLEMVRALATDRKERREDTRADYQAGLITKNEARAELGREAVPDGDVYLVPAGMSEEPMTMPLLPAPASAAKAKAETDEEVRAQMEADREASAETKARNRFEEDRDELAAIYEATVAKALEELQSVVASAAENGSLVP